MKPINLKSAEKYFKFGRYSKVIRILEPQVFNYRENERFYILLGMSCLLLGDYSGSNSYLRRALQINNTSAETMLGLAVIHLKHNNPSEAIRIWLDVLDKDHNNRYAKNGLDLLKKNEALKTVPEDFIPKYLSRLLPGPKNVIFYRFIKMSAAAFLAVLIIAAGFAGIKAVINITDKSKNILPELTISKNVSDLTMEGSYNFDLTGKEIYESFENAKKHFIENNDNLSMIEINRILYSNASAAVKEKAKLLSTYLREPDFRYFENSIEYRDVVKNPLLYNNCYIKWSGKIANIRTGTKEGSLSSAPPGNTETAVFDFLIGYDTGRVLEGIIPVEVDFPVLLDESFTYDILALLKTDNDGMMLKAVSLRNYIK